jgi:hypothetical protein
VRDRVTGSNDKTDDRLTLHRALSTCARIAATMHASGIELGPIRTLQGEIDSARAEVNAIGPLAPALATRLMDSLDAAARAATATPPALSFAHGSFMHSQFLFDGPLTGVARFDTPCISEPALDLGHFVGYLDVAVQKARTATGHWNGAVGDPGQAFLEEYVHARGIGSTDVLLDRVAAYRTVTLVRIAVQSWRQLKPARVRIAQSLLEDREQRYAS